MSNITVHSLFYSRYLQNSPLIHIQNGSKYRKIQIKDTKTLFFASPFIISSANKFKSIKNTFSHYLSSPIRLERDESQFLLNDELLIHKNFREECITSYCNVTNNAFIDIASDQDGGAIFLESDDAYVENCIFKSCSTSKNGGAIYSNSRVLDITSCCFFRCFSLHNGLTIDAKGNKVTIKSSVVFGSSLNPQAYESNTISVEEAIAVIKNLNETQNNPAREAGGIKFQRASDMDVSFFSIHSCTGKNTILSYFSQGTLYISNGNIINNSARDSIIYFSSMTSISNVIFRLNKAQSQTIRRSNAPHNTARLYRCSCDRWGELPDSVLIEDEIPVQKHESLYPVDVNFNADCKVERKTIVFQFNKGAGLFVSIILCSVVFIILMFIILRRIFGRKTRNRPAIRRQPMIRA